MQLEPALSMFEFVTDVYDSLSIACALFSGESLLAASGIVLDLASHIRGNSRVSRRIALSGTGRDLVISDYACGAFLKGRRSVPKHIPFILFQPGGAPTQFKLIQPRRCTNWQVKMGLLAVSLLLSDSLSPSVT